MNQAIEGGYYDPTGNYGSTAEDNPTLYSRIIAQEFAYWMILTGWDLKSLYAPDVAPEWTILTAAEMETTLPLAHKLFTDTVNGVLVNPTQAYLDGLTFASLVKAPSLNIESDPPVADTFTLSPSTVDVSSGAATVTFSIHITDASGIDIEEFLFKPQLTKSGAGTIIADANWAIVSGDNKDGIYEATATIPTGTIPGSYNASSGFIYDIHGNYIMGSDQRPSLTVINN
jgi:hypothetical protein